MEDEPYSNKSLSQEKPKEKSILDNYYRNKYFLEEQALAKGFGKMISARNQTNPQYSFGKERRFFSLEDCGSKDNNKEFIESYSSHYKNKLKENKRYDNLTKAITPSYNISNKIKFTSENSKRTDYYYNFVPTQKYKYSSSPHWMFSKSPREQLKTHERYKYFDNEYKPESDAENFKKKWLNRVVGGDIGIDDRFKHDNHYIKNCVSPGPGRYNPKDLYFKYNQNKSGYIGKRCNFNSYDNGNSSTKKIAPGSYNIGLTIGSNVNNFKFANSPKFLFGTSGKDNIKCNTFELGDRYLKYSSFGEQIMSSKDSRPGYSFGKLDRFKVVRK